MTESDDERRQREIMHQATLLANEIARKAEDKKRRERNIIIKGLQETNRDGDWRAISKILEYLGCPRRLNEIRNIDRIGNNRQGRRSCRLTIIEFETPSAAYEVVRKAPRLMFDTFLASIFISEDLSREEREARYNDRRRNVFNDAASGPRAGVDNGRRGGASLPATGPRNAPRRPSGQSPNDPIPAAGPQAGPQRPPGQAPNDSVPINGASNDRQQTNPADHSQQLNQNRGHSTERTSATMDAAEGTHSTQSNMYRQEMARGEEIGPGNTNGTDGSGGNASGNGRTGGGPGED